MLADRRYCYPLTISDFESRYLFACEALFLFGTIRNPCVRLGPLAIGAPDTIRTYDLGFRKALLYPTELRGRRAATLATDATPVESSRTT
jgi:hypothetical protein